VALPSAGLRRHGQLVFRRGRLAVDLVAAISGGERVTAGAELTGFSAQPPVPLVRVILHTVTPPALTVTVPLGVPAVRAPPVV